MRLNYMLLPLLGVCSCAQYPATIIQNDSNDMKSGVTGTMLSQTSHVPENANEGQKLYLNPLNNAFMLCAVVHTPTDTCVSFYEK